MAYVTCSSVPCVLDVACTQPQMLLFHPAMNMILWCAGSHHKKQDNEEWIQRQRKMPRMPLHPTLPSTGAEPWRGSRTGVPSRELHNYSSPINQLAKVDFPGVERVTGQTEVSKVLKENSIFPIGKPKEDQSISALISKPSSILQGREK